MVWEHYFIYMLLPIQAYACETVSLYSRIHIDDIQLESLSDECEQHFCQVLFLQFSPTTWTIGKAIPFHAKKIYQELGFGLGLNTMQGREAKHAKLAAYVKNTTRGNRLRWMQVFRHDFMETIWLREKHPGHVNYRRKVVVGEVPKPLEKDKFIPSQIANDNFCGCGFPKLSDVSPWEICSSELFKVVKLSCQKGSIHEKIPPDAWLKAKVTWQPQRNSFCIPIGYHGIMLYLQLHYHRKPHVQALFT